MKIIDYIAPIVLTVIVMISVLIGINVITEEEIQEEGKVAYTEYCTEECETYHSNDCEKASVRF